LRSAENAILADHTSFDSPTILEFYHARNDAAVREVHPTDTRAALCDHRTLLQLSNAELRPEVLKIDRTCSGKNAII